MPAAIGYRNEFANGYVSAPLLLHNMTSAIVDPAYPLSNVLTPHPARVSRIVFTNSSGSSKVAIIRKQVSGSNDKTFRVVAALNVRLPVGQWDSCYFGLFTVDLLTGGGYTVHIPAEAVPIPGTDDRYDVFALLPADVGGRAQVEFGVYFPTGTSGLMEVGCLWAGPALIWMDGIDGLWKHLLLDDSVVVRSPAGAWSVYPYPTRHGIELSRSLLTYEQAIGNPSAPAAASLRSVLREVGTSQPVIVMPRSSSSHERQTLSVYGLFQPPLPEIAHQGGNRYSVGLRCW